jgi:hypothetical protein
LQTDTNPERPRLRDDLVVSTLDDEGVRYVDVSDPTSGSKFRFFEVEYVIAQAMNGQRDLGAVAEYVRAEVGVEASTSELWQVQATLAELGYLHGGAAAAPAGPQPMAAAAERPVTVDAHAAGLVLGERPVTPAPIPAPVAARPPEDFGDVLPAAPSLADAHVTDEERTKIPAGDEVSVDLSAHLSLDKKQVADAVKASRVMQAVAPPIDMMDDEESDGGSAESDFGGGEATRLAPEVQVLAAKEAARQPALLSSGASEDDAVTKVAQKALETAAATKKPEPVAAKPEPAKPEPAKVEPRKEAKPAEKKESAAKPLPARPGASAQIPAVAATTPAAEAPRRSMVPFLAIILLLACGGFAVWWFLFREVPNQGYSSPPPAPLTENKPEAPKPVPRLGAKVVEEPLAVLELKAPAAGKVALTAGPGEVAQGASLLTLAGGKKWQDQKTQATARRDVYQKALDAAQAKGDTKGVSDNGAKVKEKQDLITQADAELAKLAVSAPEAGTVEVLVAANAAVTADQVVAKLTPSRKKKLVRFDHLDGFSGPYGPEGAPAVKLVAKGKPDAEAVILPIGKDETSAIVVIPDELPIGAGDEIELLPASK